MTNSTRSGSSSRCVAPVHIPLARRRQSSHPQLRPETHTTRKTKLSPTRFDPSREPDPSHPHTDARVGAHVRARHRVVLTRILHRHRTRTRVRHRQLTPLDRDGGSIRGETIRCIFDFLSRPPGPIHKPARRPSVPRPRHRITGAGYLAQPAGVRVRSLRGSPRRARARRRVAGDHRQLDHAART